MGLLDALKAMSRPRSVRPVDPSRFQDPLASQVPWTPLVPGGANFRTHALESSAPGTLRYRKSGGYVLFGLIFLTVGLAVTGVGLVMSEWMPTLFGLPFAAIGVFVLLPRTLQFDGDTRQFTGRKGALAFSAIHAVQLLEEVVTSSDSADYSSFELNLVLSGGERVNVVDHSDIATLRDEAQRIASLVGCKVWDATG